MRSIGCSRAAAHRCCAAWSSVALAAGCNRVFSLPGLALIAARRHGRERPMPFGPYLAAAGFIALLWGRDLIGAYWQAGAP